MNWEAMSMCELMDVGCNALHRISSSSGDGCSVAMNTLLMAQYIAPYGVEIKKNLAGLGYEF